MAERAPTNLFAFDIGGTLTKVVFFEPDELQHQRRRQLQSSEVPKNAGRRRALQYLLGSTRYGKTGVRNTELRLPVPGGTLHFMRYRGVHCSRRLPCSQILPHVVSWWRTR